jgi:hypothetical protein
MGNTPVSGAAAGHTTDGTVKAVAALVMVGPPADGVAGKKKVDFELAAAKAAAFGVASAGPLANTDPNKAVAVEAVVPGTLILGTCLVVDEEAASWAPPSLLGSYT